MDEKFRFDAANVVLDPVSASRLRFEIVLNTLKYRELNVWPWAFTLTAQFFIDRNWASSI